MSQSRQVTLRRNLQQALHCVQEALSVVERDEDLRCAVDDVKHARLLLDEIAPVLYLATGERGTQEQLKGRRTE